MTPTQSNVILRRSWRARECRECGRTLRAGARVVCEIVPAIPEREPAINSYALDHYCTACALWAGLVR